MMVSIGSIPVWTYLDNCKYITGGAIVICATKYWAKLKKW